MYSAIGGNPLHAGSLLISGVSYISIYAHRYINSHRRIRASTANIIHCNIICRIFSS